jgi:hypothetical protein
LTSEMACNIFVPISRSIPVSISVWIFLDYRRLRWSATFWCPAPEATQAEDTTARYPNKHPTGYPTDDSSRYFKRYPFGYLCGYLCGHS